MKAAGFRRALLDWYGKVRRELPWRRTDDPYRIWISEIMLQQTRVAAVIPYYEKFLNRFPDIASLANATESDVLAHWAGLGYYSRARNLQRAAKMLAASGFPSGYEAIRELPGIGDYTAAAIASIAFGLPHAAVDGNVLRVMSRIANDASDIQAPSVRRRMSDKARILLHPKRPGDWNQAMMELGATVCTPREPACGRCPVAKYCEACAAGTAAQLPVKLRSTKRENLHVTILVVRKGGKLLVRPSRQMAGFWELPDLTQAPGFRVRKSFGSFTHQITFRKHTCTVVSGAGPVEGEGLTWVAMADLEALPFTTMARKALALAH